MTPNDLARELDRDPKLIRAWLREDFTREEWEKWSHWLLSEKQVEHIRERSAKAETRREPHR
jgi:hypothetical protein